MILRTRDLEGDRESDPRHPRWIFTAQSLCDGQRGRLAAGEHVERIASVRASEAITRGDGPVVSIVRLRSIQHHARDNEGSSGQYGAIDEIVDSGFAGRALVQWAGECAARVLSGPPAQVDEVRRLIDLKLRQQSTSDDRRAWTEAWSRGRHLFDGDTLLGRSPAQEFLNSGLPAHALAREVAKAARNVMRYRPSRAAFEDEVRWQERRLVGLLKAALAEKSRAVRP